MATNRAGVLYNCSARASAEHYNLVSASTATHPQELAFIEVGVGPFDQLSLNRIWLVYSFYENLKNPSGAPNWP